MDPLRVFGSHVVLWLKHFVGEVTTNVLIPVSPLRSHALCFHYAIELASLIK